MATKMNSYKVFIASPTGLEDEREAFVKEINDYNDIEALPRDVFFQPIGWENTLPGIGRPQSLINEQLKICEYFVLVLHDRWGSYPGYNEKGATSGTMEEYKIALDCYRDAHSPMKQVVCLFKSIPPNQLADPGPQLQKVLEFKKKLESEKLLLYGTFSSLTEFTQLLRKNLAKWLRDDNGVTIRESISIPLSDRSAKISLVNTGQKLDASINVDPDTNELIQHAWELALKGKPTEAEIQFSRALIYNPRENQLLNYSEFLINTGQIEKALVMINRVFEITKSGNETNSVADAYSLKGDILRIKSNFNDAKKMYGNSLKINEKTGREDRVSINYGKIGIILLTEGDHDGAKKMFNKSLEIEKKLGNELGMASQYGNIGSILQTKGDLEGAEDMFRHSLMINKNHGRIDGMAIQYGNIGNILKIRGNLNGALEMYKNALEIFTKMGSKEGMANQYGSIGEILQIQGDLQGAVDLFKKSLAINEELARIEGMAADYTNIGLILMNKGDLEEAEKMWNKALEINTRIRKLVGMASCYNNIGYILRERGDWEGAIDMCKKSFEINEKLGDMKGMAADYANLGRVLKDKRDLEGATDMFNKSLEINEKLGNMEGVANDYANLGNIFHIKGDIQGAAEMYHLSLNIAKTRDLKNLIEKINHTLENLKN